MSAVALVALIRPGEFLFLVPICLAIALVTSAAHREDMREILRHAVRAWIVTVAGILVFMLAVTIIVEVILP